MKSIFKRQGNTGKQHEGSPQVGANLVDGYELRAPSAQNAAELISGWSTQFPNEIATTDGTLNLLADSRLEWAISRYGDLHGKRVLELGPLEAGHTFMLETAGADVDAVESSGVAFLKCLITKELLGLKRARFLLGDCNAWLEENETRYDLIVASGILYHMVQPLRLIQAIASRTDNLFLWTMFIDDDQIPPTHVENLLGVAVRHYRIAYGARTSSFCGGANPDAMWLHKADIHAVLSALGYDRIEMQDTEPMPLGLSGMIFASRSNALP